MNHGACQGIAQITSNVSASWVTQRFGAGCVENELGLRKFLEDRGHTLVVTDDKEGDSSELDKHLPDTDIVRPARWLALSQHMLCTA